MIFFWILGPINSAAIKKETFSTNCEEELEEEEDLEVPREITELFTCPMCFKKYASHSDMENHIAIFHKIPRKIQRQSLQAGNNSMFVIKKEDVVIKLDADEWNLFFILELNTYENIHTTENYHILQNTITHIDKNFVNCIF